MNFLDKLKTLTKQIHHYVDTTPAPHNTPAELNGLIDAVIDKFNDLKNDSVIDLSKTFFVLDDEDKLSVVGPHGSLDEASDAAYQSSISQELGSIIFVIPASPSNPDTAKFVNNVINQSDTYGLDDTDVKLYLCNDYSIKDDIPNNEDDISIMFYAGALRDMKKTIISTGFPTIINDFPTTTSPKRDF